MATDAVAGAGMETTPAVEASGAGGRGGGMVVVIGVVVVCGGEDMIEQEQSDTKVVGARVLPGLGRRL